MHDLAHTTLDLIEHDGLDLRDCPFLDREAVLARLEPAAHARFTCGYRSLCRVHCGLPRPNRRSISAESRGSDAFLVSNIYAGQQQTQQQAASGISQVPAR
jgi:hypothetical protein